MGNGAEIRREVILKSAGGKSTQRVDFFRRNFGSAHWDIVELKSPKKEFVVSNETGHPTHSAWVHRAINQAEDYRDLIASDAALRQRLLAIGIAVFRPQITVVIGKDHENIPDEIMAALHDRIRRGPINVHTYNDIYRFAKEHYKSSGIILTGTLVVGSNQIVRFGEEKLRAFRSEGGSRSIVSVGVSKLVDSSTIEMFGDALNAYLETKSPKEVVLDFSETDFMSSSFLLTLFRGHLRARKLDKQILLTGLRPSIRELLTHTKLDRVFELEVLNSRRAPD